MPDYTESGFNKLLQRNSDTSKDEFLEDETSQRNRQISGSSINSGEAQSSNKKLTISWDEALLKASDGARNRVQVGNINKTGNYGIQVLDKKGNVRLEFSDSLQQFTMYNSSYQKLIQVDQSGFHGYDTSENERTRVNANGLTAYALPVVGSDAPAVTISQIGGSEIGSIGLSSSGLFYMSATAGIGMYLFSGSNATFDLGVAGASTLTLNGNVTISGLVGLLKVNHNASILGNLVVGGSLTVSSLSLTNLTVTNSINSFGYEYGGTPGISGIVDVYDGFFDYKTLIFDGGLLTAIL